MLSRGDGPRSTRVGGCRPTLWLVKRAVFVRVNRALNAVVRRFGLSRFRGGDLLYLTTVGRKSGADRTTPAIYLRDGDSWVVAASNAGADWEPGWWLNLRSGSPAWVEVDGHRTAVSGSEIEEPERAEWWRRLNDVLDYDAYQRKVSRRIAVVRLSPKGQ